MANHRDTSDGETVPIPAWAHRIGLLSLCEPPTAGKRDEALDRQLIQERIARYCWAFDERQATLLGNCFTENAIWEGTVLGRIPIGPFNGRDTILQWLTEFWPYQHDQRRHMLLNTVVEGLSSTRAVTLSYLLLMSADGKAASIEATGFYRTAYRLENGMWQISCLTAGFDKPFWPGDLERMSSAGRSRHGIAPGS